MTSRPRLRKLVLTAHVVASVGWLGAVVVSLALGIIGLASQDARVVRGAYLALHAIGWPVLIPLGLASLFTGLVQSLGTQWGLLRHYWIVFKLAINLFATVILAAYTQTLSYLAGLAASGAELSVLRSASPVLHAGGGLVLLLVATALSVYKPQGRTRYGQRRLHEQRRAMPMGGRQRSVTGAIVHRPSAAAFRRPD